MSGLASGALGLPVAVALACLPIVLTGRQIARWEGGVLLTHYAACAAYVAYLILATQQHDALAPFSAVMLRKPAAAP